MNGHGEESSYQAGSRLLGYFASHPTAANLLLLIFLFLGALSIGDILRETFPDYSSSEVQISVVYPGATAEEVEEAVCRRIEDAVDSVTYVSEVESEAREGLAQVIVTMSEQGEMTSFLNDIKTEVEAITDFPDEAEAPTIKQLNKTDLVCAVAVSGPMSVTDLELYCEQLKQRMLRIPEISQITIEGFSERQLRVEVPVSALRRFGVSVNDVADAIARQSVNLPAGTIETYGRDVLIRFNDERGTVQGLEDLLVYASGSGAELALGDFATITDSFELDEDKLFFNGKRAGLLKINKIKSEDALNIMDKLRSFLEAERLAAPAGVDLSVTQNVSEIVRDRLNLLSLNGVQGFVLVFLVMWAFFSFRFSFWVAMGMPVSFAGALFFMQQFGFSLNMLSMVGLLLALGLIMDDAIVIAENVATHLQQGADPLAAAVRGTSEVAGGVLSSFLTTMFIFGSIAVFIAGDIGKVLWVMPVVLLLTLSVSLVEAFLILPNHLAHSLRAVQGKEPGRFRRWFDRRLEFARDRILGGFVDWTMNWRYLFVGLVIALFLISLSMLAGGVLKTQAFPEVDGDVLMARILLPQGTPLERTEAIVRQVTDALDRVDKSFTPLQPLFEGKPRHLVENISIQFNANPDANESGPHLATVIADLLSAQDRNARLDAVAELWRKEVGNLPDVINITYKQPRIGPAGMAIDIRLQGEDLQRLKSASLELMDWLGQYAGVKDLSDDLRPGKPEVDLRLKEGALALGLDSQTIASQLRAALYGKTADEIQRGDISYEIVVSLADPDQNSVADLEYFHITTADDKLVPLFTVAEANRTRGWSRIAHVNGLRTVTIKGDVDTRQGNADNIISDTRKRFLPDLQKRYPDLSIGLEGQAKESSKTAKSLRKALLVGIFGIFVLLSFQFKSYMEPLVVIVAIPLALIGVIWGHLLMGYPLTMPGIMGFVSLAGVVVNDSILLVQFIKRRVSEGLQVADAARTASRQRFRAILLTSLTTIAGLFPLMLERSLQAQVLIPLAISIVFGLLASTVLVLAVVPSLYAILADFGLAGHRNSSE